MELLPYNDTAVKMQQLRKDFLDLYTKIRMTYELYSEVTALSTSIKSWLSEFLYIYPKSDVTPYMHAFVMHVPVPQNVQKPNIFLISKVWKSTTMNVQRTFIDLQITRTLKP